MNVSNVGDLERRLEGVGWSVGVRLLEILTYRERAGRRETRLLDMLRFVHSTVWKYMFGRTASDLEQSNTVCFVLFSLCGIAIVVECSFKVSSV